jgi:hypothetical protein
VTLALDTILMVAMFSRAVVGEGQSDGMYVSHPIAMAIRDQNMQFQ